MGGRAARIVLAVAILTGCGSVPIPPTYSQDELRMMCQRHGGWWHPGGLAGGYCEPDSHL